MRLCTDTCVRRSGRRFAARLSPRGLVEADEFQRLEKRGHLRGQDGGNQFRVVVLRRVDTFADWGRDHVGVGILFYDCECFFRRGGEPGVEVLFGQDGGHAVFSIVDFRHEFVGGHGDDGAGLDLDAVGAGG